MYTIGGYDHYHPEDDEDTIKEIPCPDCDKGWIILLVSKKQCPRCKGTGRIKDTDKKPK